jgi:hypothetical protein
MYVHNAANELLLFDENVVNSNSNNKGTLKFIANQGLTVEAIRKKQIIITQSGSKDIGFKSETDNVSRYLQIYNMVCVPLINESKTVVAVMQLINKIDGDINDKDRVYP